MKTKGLKKTCNVKFASDIGVFLHFSSLLKEDNEESSIVAISWDHSFQPVKGPSNFPFVTADVVVSEICETSEFGLEKKGVKDDLVAWRERYKSRQSKIEA